ncbi:hypothetical protein PV08_10914 [Exophiala spinifera]|uniref:N-acetyltransferase domain-containing protein n=1 Tax=Exophiala spinifera TaxID=91928 RepID=A0A0D1ZF56_9EURO|nr:uncharacterized protein PV08_10914 [Exophiala spinifera]KIW11612.1 hypothetical protein PV08_10914 [Exophiala spinifera]
MALTAVAGPALRVTKPEELVPFAQVLTRAFANDKLNRYLFLGRESRPDHPRLSQHEERLQYWLSGVQKRFERESVLLQSSDFAAVALWIPPGVEKPEPPTTATEGVFEYTTKVKQAKKKHLGDRLHWNLNLIGRMPDRSDRGAIRALISPMLEKAREDNLPAWLEATNDHARDVYAHLGFKVVDQFRIGEGVVNSEGWIQENGEGVLIYAMTAGL